MTDEYVPTRYAFEVYHLEVGGEHLETWGLMIPVSELRAEDIGCYLSLKHPTKILQATCRWGILEQVGAVRSNPVENRAERYLTIEGVDYCLDVRREVWIGLRRGGPDHFKRGGITR